MCVLWIYIRGFDSSPVEIGSWDLCSLEAGLSIRPVSDVQVNYKIHIMVAMEISHRRLHGIKMTGLIIGSIKYQHLWDPRRQSFCNFPAPLTSLHQMTVLYVMMAECARKPETSVTVNNTSV